jgi:alpha-1,6-mannosyltransferase
MAFAERLERLAAPGPAVLTNLALLLFGAIYIDLTWAGTQEFHRYIHGFGVDMFGQMLLFLGAIALIERSPTDRWTLPILLLAAFGARVTAIVHPPFLSTDIYRYVWDGKVQAAGINPFRYIPADPHLAFLRDAQIYPHINRRTYAHTIYPPGAQIFFLLVARLHASVIFMKSALLVCEAVTCAALIRCLTLLGQPRERVLLYAWQPVCVWEIGSSGHIDALAVTAIALALMARLQGRPRGAVAWLGAATLVKLYPVVLFPAFLRRRIVGPLLLLVGIVAAGYLPYISVGRGVFGFLPEYAKEEGIDSGVRFFPLDVIDRAIHISIPSSAYIAACMVLMAALALWAWRAGVNRQACVAAGLVLATGLTLCFSPHYPWYFLWLLPFLTLWPWRPAFFLVIGVTYLLSTKFGAPREIFQMNTLLYGGFFLLLALDLLVRARPQRGPGAPQPASLKAREP